MCFTDVQSVSRTLASKVFREEDTFFSVSPDYLATATASHKVCFTDVQSVSRTLASKVFREEDTSSDT